MNNLARLISLFEVNWTTILAGWNGTGPFSPWPDRRDDFPPFVSTREIAEYADTRLAPANDVELKLILSLQELISYSENRQLVRDLLVKLERQFGGDETIEIRKWRLVLLQRLLEETPQDAVAGLMALTEFWQGFGYPSDCPQEIQGLRNDISPEVYYTDANYNQILDRNLEWLEKELPAIRSKPSLYPQ